MYTGITSVIVSMSTINIILIMCLIVLMCTVVYKKKVYSKWYTSSVCIIST